jgi:copper chaperone CopZ
MRDLRVSVQGMGCRQCVREVTGRLRDVPGVHTAVADIATHTVRLTGSMANADVLSALAGTTYVAHIQ